MKAAYSLIILAAVSGLTAVQNGKKILFVFVGTLDMELAYSC